MKKASVILSSALVLGTLLAGCGNSNKAENAAATTAPVATATAAAEATAAPAAETGKYQDGTYYGTVDADPETGWQTFTQLTVEGGKITKADWNAFNVKKAGDLKKKVSEDGNYGLVKIGGAKSEWHEQAALAEAYLIEKQDPAALTVNAEGKTDAISGVSVHVSDFVGAAQAALAAGPAQAGPYKDGGYTAEGEMDATSGWKSTVALSVANGNVVAVNFSGVNAAGDDKKQYSVDGKYGMKAGGAAAEWHEEIALAEKYFLENKGVAPTLDAEGKTDAISGVSIHVGEYFTLAQKALEGAK
ncbi:FMN-binding protein [Paenibacillus silagei]|uniref:Major membrane immunogen (Membrane-anchored lipoprotein) n=1 Tax=Paenibacillus silagei TaxID=1670801 RepID=A0ABS4NX51_9BACL|nr:FMN-binding protein [Paenibacillus silagei]MBP2114638.1 major membrane immunogen (membrane-anchored lipoprotein) [Paenibacillus silagei]